MTHACWQHLHDDPPGSGHKDLCRFAAEPCMWGFPCLPVCPFNGFLICRTSGGVIKICVLACVSVHNCLYMHIRIQTITQSQKLHKFPILGIIPDSRQMCPGALFSSAVLHTPGANSKISDKEHVKHTLGSKLSK